jgi:hypothetical protein
MKGHKVMEIEHFPPPPHMSEERQQLILAHCGNDTLCHTTWFHVMTCERCNAIFLLASLTEEVYSGNMRNKFIDRLIEYLLITYPEIEQLIDNIPWVKEHLDRKNKPRKEKQ